MLSTAVHALAQSTYDPPPALPRKTLTPIRAPLGGVQYPQALGFGDNGESGTYTYDGSGNITAIGADTFLYDAEGRVVTAVIRGVTGTYTYDAFGNRKTGTGETNCYGQTVCATPLTLDSTTNRLLTTTNGTTTNVGYDAAGNITSASGGVYAYDGTGMMTEATVGSDDRQFVYTADDERIAVRQGQSWMWTVRGLDNKVLREFTSTEPNNSAGLPTAGGTWIKDYIWRDGLLLASTDSTGTYHYHLDHLGTPRLITNASGVKVAEHAYYPFGAEISLTPHEANEEAMKFTGHERDIVVGDGYTLDDMHARYYNATLGRFLSADPVLGGPDDPQSWNRYSYARDNPLRFSDPTGRQVAQEIYAAGAFAGAYILCSYAASPSAAVPGKTNVQVLVQTAIDGFSAVKLLLGLIPGRQRTNIPTTPPPPATTPSQSGTPGTQATTGVNPAAPIQARVVNTSHGPVTIPSDYTPRVSDSGKGTVYQAPGATGNADMIRVMNPTARYPTGYVVIHNSYGQPVTIDGKTGSPAETHHPIEEKLQ
ncbi:MAG TPA: RHS repeat-associated core domain-containing protein [Thermoanaerobaculia bacterium]|nr:RHS repeat-associated core domain-containing protein [Thermoanaerobaculia bacterium]